MSKEEIINGIKEKIIELIAEEGLDISSKRVLEILEQSKKEQEVGKKR